MRPTRLRTVIATSLAAGIAATVLAAPAGAASPHVVQPGETLWSIAAANNLTTRTVAAYNGLSEDSQVVLGSTVQIPTTVEGYASLQQAGLVSADPAQAAAPSGGAPATSQATAATAAPAPSSGPAPQGHYKVRSGDTLGGAGAQLRRLAGGDGRHERHRPVGRAGRRHRAQAAHGRARAPAGVHAGADADRDPAGRPGARLRRGVGAGDIQSVASQYGVSPSLAAAIAWQESGFNNGMVSSANARGVMQVMPGTWSYVQDNLAPRALDPNSATDNVHAGVLYLKRLLNETGGDESAAIAGYYQGLSSVQSRGMYDDTRQYVDNVQALRGRFGG